MTAQAGFSFNDFRRRGTRGGIFSPPRSSYGSDPYSDGVLGNLGPAATAPSYATRRPSGAVHEKEPSAGFSCTTNNRMELLGCIVAWRP